MKAPFGNPVSLIKEAAKSYLGVLSLMIFLPSAVAVFLFSGTGEYVRLSAFVALLSAFFGFLFAVARIVSRQTPQISKGVFKATPQSLNLLLGNWHGYYLLWIGGEVTLMSENWEIREKQPGAISVSVKTVGDRNLSFTGFLEVERGQFLVKLNAVEHDGECYCRFKLPISGNDSITDGIFLGIDFNGRITAGAHLLARAPLDPKTALKQIADQFPSDQKSKRVICIV